MIHVSYSSGFIICAHDYNILTVYNIILLSYFNILIRPRNESNNLFRDQLYYFVYTFRTRRERSSNYILIYFIPFRFQFINILSYIAAR